tara:strand:- start:919 stop:1731 length:813 start_codon:yes stop_codon:yes gene_type:complete
MKVDSPKISVIMSVYNGKRYLKESIDSILNQSFTSFEFIIIDDLSHDNSKLIIEEYAKKDSRIIFLKNKKNRGLTYNLNQAISISRGELIARMDCDDVSMLNRFSKQVDFLNKNKSISIVGSYSINIDKHGNEISKRIVPSSNFEILKVLPMLNPISHPTVMFRKDDIVAIGCYNTKYRTSQDYFLWFQAASNSLLMFNMPEFLLYYRMDDEYISKKSFKYRMNEFLIKIKGYQLIKLPFYKYYLLLVPLVLGFLPSFLFKYLKKLDPRS